MVNAVYVLLAVLAVTVPVFVLTPVVRSWWRARSAHVEMDALEVAFREVFHIQ